MRIIAGTHRGRRFAPPSTDATRPITDRAKQSLFDVLSPRLDGAVVFDLFAGTGSMGLECLSRSARHVTFFECDRSAVRLLRRNIDDLGFAAGCDVIPGDLFAAFADPQRHAGPVDLIFLDPPYRMLKEEPTALVRLAERLAPRLAADGLVLFRHDAADVLDLPALRCTDTRRYGGMAIELLTKSTST